MHRTYLFTVPQKAALGGGIALLTLLVIAGAATSGDHIASAQAAATAAATSAGTSPGTSDDTPPTANPDLFKYDASAPLNVKEVGTKQQDGATIHDITFTPGNDGKPVSAYIVTPAGSGPFAGILYVHWLGEPETTNRTEFLNEAITLASQGTVSVLVDTMWAKPGWYGSRKPDQDYANSIKQVIELRRAMDLLLAQQGVDSQRIAYVGHDFGAMYGAVMGGVDPRAKTYVLMAAAPHFSDWAFFGPKPKDKAAYLKQNAVLDPVLYVHEIKNASVFFQFGNADNYVSEAQYDAFFAAANARKQMTIYGVGHAVDVPDAHRDRVVWLQNELGLTASK